MKTIAFLIFAELASLFMGANIALTAAQAATAQLQHVADAIDHVNHGVTEMDLNLKPHIDAVAESMKQEVATVNGRRVTRGELNAAFNLVVNKSNWKGPIDAKVWLTAEQVAMVTEAVTFFAGCVPEFASLRRQDNEVGERRYRVTAVGYYEAVGA